MDADENGACPDGQEACVTDLECDGLFGSVCCYAKGSLPEDCTIQPSQCGPDDGGKCADASEDGNCPAGQVACVTDFSCVDSLVSICCYANGSLPEDCKEQPPEPSQCGPDDSGKCADANEEGNCPAGQVACVTDLSCEDSLVSICCYNNGTLPDGCNITLPPEGACGPNDQGKCAAVTEEGNCPDGQVLCALDANCGGETPACCYGNGTLPEECELV